MKTAIITGLLVFLILFGLEIAAQQKGENYLILKAEAIKIQETIRDEDAHSYHTVDYKVISICKGEFEEDTIRVAHIVGTAKNLKVGDVNTFAN